MFVGVTELDTAALNIGNWGRCLVLSVRVALGNRLQEPEQYTYYKAHSTLTLHNRAI